MRASWTRAAIGLLTLAAPAHAQTAPTPDNAQKFIIQMLQGAMTTSNGMTGSELYNASAVTAPSGGGCATSLWKGSVRYDIDWTKIRAAASVSADVLKVSGVISYTENGRQGTFQDLWFDLSSPDAAQRVLKAFEVLRKACEPGSGLGF